MTKKYVLWSGGYDSTACLLSACEGSSKNDPVVAISINHDSLCSNQFKAEALARNKILKELKRRGYYIEELKISVKSKAMTVTNGWCQQLWWLTIAANYMEDKSKIAVGFILGSEFWKHQREYEQIFEGIGSIMRKKIKLLYPCGDMIKASVLQYVHKSKLEKFIWTCDTPIKFGKKFKKCGTCSKCIEEKLGKYHMKLIKEAEKCHMKLINDAEKENK